MRTYTGITARGNRFTVEGLGNHITCWGGEAVIISVRDVSKRTIAEEELKRRERLYRLLAEDSNDMINRHDANLS